MNILFIGKYPPIQGGVSSYAFWRINKILEFKTNWYYYVLSQFPQDLEYIIDWKEMESVKNHERLSINLTDPLATPSVIPKMDFVSEKMISLGLDLCKKQNFDLIEAEYLIPYGFVAYILSKFTGLPYIIRHAGSDIQRIMKTPSLFNLSKIIIKSASKVITYPLMEMFFKKYIEDSNKIAILDIYRHVPQEFFNASKINPLYTLDKEGNEHKYLDNNPIILFPGKPSVGKGFFVFLNALKKLYKLNDSYKVLLTVGRYSKSLKIIYRLIEKFNLESNVLLTGYKHPYHMPNLYSKSAMVITPEFHFSISIHNTIIPREALCSNTPVIISSEIGKKYPYNTLSDMKEIMVFNAFKPESMVKKILYLIQNENEAKRIALEGQKFSRKFEAPNEWITQEIKTIEKVLEE